MKFFWRFVIIHLLRNELTIGYYKHFMIHNAGLHFLPNIFGDKNIYDKFLFRHNYYAHNRNIVLAVPVSDLPDQV